MINIFQEFEGTVREFLIVLDGIQVFIFLEIAILFYYRAYRSNQGKYVNLGWAIVFSLFGFLAGGTLYRIYYLDPAIWQSFLTFFLMLSFFPILSIVLIMEYFIQKYRRTKYVFSLISLILGIASIFTVNPINDIITSLITLTLLIFAIMFFTKLIKLSSGVVHKNVIIFTISFFGLMIGNFLANPRTLENVIAFGGSGEILAIVSKAIQICSIVVMAAVLFKLPIFFEVNWSENLIQLYVIHRLTGISIFHIRFQKTDVADEDQNEISEELVAGGMYGITTMLKEISQSTEELKTIDHGDQKIMLDHRDNVLLALNVRKEMRIYWDKLQHLQDIIEIYFGKFLENWDGNLDYFKPLEGIVIKEFS